MAKAKQQYRPLLPPKERQIVAKELAKLYEEADRAIQQATTQPQLDKLLGGRNAVSTIMLRLGLIEDCRKLL